MVSVKDRFQICVNSEGGHFDKTVKKIVKHFIFQARLLLHFHGYNK